MIVTVFIGLYHIYEQSRKVECVCRCTNLITYYCELVMCLANIQHCLDEVLAIYAKYPRYTHDKVLLKGICHCKLSVELCLPIYVERCIVLAVRLPWCGALSVKYIVCADIYHFGIYLLAGIRDILCAVCVDCMHLCFFIIILGQIYCCPCCTVYYHVRLKLCDCFFHCITVCDVK